MAMRKLSINFDGSGLAWPVLHAYQRTPNAIISYKQTADKHKSALSLSSTLQLIADCLYIYT